jgi:acetyltransferase-like isoleucine patch superfamily enzyme
MGKAAKEAVGAGVIHPTAIIESPVEIGANVNVWHFCHVRKNVKLHDHVSLGRDCFIDQGVEIGAYARIQNGVSVYHGVHISSWVFVGPHVIFTNDMSPRVGKKNWKLVETQLDLACSIGAGAIVRCGVRLGAFSMIGAGSVVTRDIPPFTLAMGNPARPSKQICACGEARFPLSVELEDPFCLNCHSNLPEELKDLAAQEFKSARAAKKNGSR